MQLHQAQNSRGIVSHVPGLFLKRSRMDWDSRQKIVWQELDDNVRLYSFHLEGQQVKAFYNSKVCFFGFPEEEGFRPLSKDQLARLKEAVQQQRSTAKPEPEAQAEQAEDQDFERARAHAELGRLIQQRPNLSGARLAGNTRRIRNLVHKYNLKPPRGI